MERDGARHQGPAVAFALIGMGGRGRDPLVIVGPPRRGELAVPARLGRDPRVLQPAADAVLPARRVRPGLPARPGHVARWLVTIWRRSSSASTWAGRSWREWWSSRPGWPRWSGGAARAAPARGGRRHRADHRGVHHGGRRGRAAVGQPGRVHRLADDPGGPVRSAGGRVAAARMLLSSRRSPARPASPPGALACWPTAWCCGRRPGCAGPDRRAARDQRDLRRAHRHAGISGAVRPGPHRRRRAGRGQYPDAQPRLTAISGAACGRIWRRGGPRGGSGCCSPAGP